MKIKSYASYKKGEELKPRLKNREVRDNTIRYRTVLKI